jgi:hypothetical protein
VPVVTWRSRPLWAVAAAFAALRSALVAGRPVASFYDTAGYREGVSLAGANMRPWVYPLALDVLQAGWLVVAVQVAVAVVAFVLLAFTVARAVEHPALRWAAFVAVLMLGVWPRVAAWDVALLTESLTFSLTCLLIVAWRWGQPWAFVAVFVAWVFLRDAHAFLAAPVVACFAWRYRRTWATAGAVVLTVWGLLASFNDDRIEHANTAANVAWHVGDDPEWFTARGLERGDWWSESPYLRYKASLTDVEFHAWIGEHPTVYVDFLLSHPGDLLHPLATAETFDYPAGYGSARRLPVTGVAVAAVFAAALGVCLVRRWDHRMALPAFLAGSVVPHQLLVMHGSPIEHPRHGVLLVFLFALGCAWIAVVAFDVLLRRGELRHRECDVTDVPLAVDPGQRRVPQMTG